MRLRFIVVMCLLLPLAAACAACGDSSTAAGPSPSTAAQKDAVEYLHAVERLLKSDPGGAGEKAASTPITWEDRSTWPAWVEAWDKVVVSYRAAAAQLDNVSPPPAFTRAHDKLLQSHSVAARSISHLLDGMRAGRSLDDLYELWQEQLEIYDVNRTVRAALTAGARQSGVRLPVGLLDLLPVEPPPAQPSPAPQSAPAPAGG